MYLKVIFDTLCFIFNIWFIIYMFLLFIGALLGIRFDLINVYIFLIFTFFRQYSNSCIFNNIAPFWPDEVDLNVFKLIYNYNDEICLLRFSTALASIPNVSKIFI